MRISRTWTFYAAVLLLSASLVVTSGCSTSPPERSPTSGYKYHTLIRSASGKYRHADVLELGETYVYSYGFRVKDLHEISHDLSVAAKIFIERRNGIPPECTNGIKIIATGLLENGGAAASAECM
jgi:hypothetical protein